MEKNDSAEKAQGFHSATVPAGAREGNARHPRLPFLEPPALYEDGVRFALGIRTPDLLNAGEGGEWTI